MVRGEQRVVACDRVARLSRVACVVVVAGLAGVSWGQLAPPPTEPAPAAPAPAPEPTPPPRQPAANPGTADPVGRAQGALRDPSQVPLPNLPYDSLVETDAAGRVKLLDVNPHLAALDVNPLLDDAGIERCLGAIAARRDKVERRIAEHAQLVHEIRNGAIERVDIGRPDTIRAVIDVVRPFQELGNLSDDLREAGALNDQQWAFNWKIAQEYAMAYQRDQMAVASENEDPDAPSPQTVITRVVLRDIVRESMGVYDDLLVEGAGRIDEVMALVTLDDGQRDQASRLAGAVRSASTDAARRDAMQAIVDVLTPDQRRPFVQAILDTR